MDEKKWNNQEEELAMNSVEELNTEELDGVAGGVDPFADHPRVPTPPIHPDMEELDLEELDGVAGGVDPFADHPRVPIQPKRNT